MTSTAVQVLTETLVWVVGPAAVVAALIGLGMLVLRRHVGVTPAVTALAGLCLLVGVATVADLVVALGRASALITLPLGWIALALGHRRWEAGALRRLAVVVVITSVAYRLGALVLWTPDLRFDGGLYHLSVMEWMAAEPTPAGLANLHGRYGFGSAWLATAAAVRWQAIGWAHLTVLEVAARAVAAALLLEVVRGARSTGDRVTAAVAGGVLVVSVPLLTLYPNGTDGVPGTMVVVAGVALLAVVLLPRVEDRATWVPVAVLAASIAVATKASTAPIAVVLLIVLVRAAVRDRGALRGRLGGPLVPVAALAVLASVVHGVTTSGCLGYPVASTCLDLPWTVPSWMPLEDARLIRTWARAQAAATAATAAPFDVSWVPRWLPRYLASAEAIVVVSASAVGAVGRGRLRRSTLGGVAGGVRAGRDRARRLVAGVIVVLVGVLVVAAPIVATLLHRGTFPILGHGPLDPDGLRPLSWYLRGLATRVGTIAPAALSAAWLLRAPASAVLDAEERRRLARVTRVVVIVAAVWLAWWLIAGPDVRFAVGVHLLLAGTVVAPALLSIDDALPRSIARLRTVARRPGAMALLVVAVALAAVVDPRVPLRAPEVRSREVVTEPDGLVLLVPEDGGRCWDLVRCAPAAPSVDVRRLGRRLVLTPSVSDRG